MSFAERIYNGVMGKKSGKERERERVNFIRELLSIYQRKKIRENDLNDRAKNIASDFLVDEITATKNGGDIVVNSEKRIRLPAKTNSELFGFVRQKFPETKMMTVKIGEKYHTYYIDNDVLYNMRSNGSLSSLEAKRIVKRVNEGRIEWPE